VRAGEYASEPSSLTGVGGTLYFTARDGTHGRELWKSDGTEAGTLLVRDVRPGVGNEYSGPESLTGVDGSLFFAGNDGVRGSELWRSDGTEAGTVLVRDINAGGAFRVNPREEADPDKGTVRVKVTVAGAGRLVVGPVGGSELRRSARDLETRGTTTITLRPTRAGMRTLRQVGRLRVTARFTFTPCGGPGSSTVREYTLRLR
jgi:ELWxxDGT repeat protein